MGREGLSGGVKAPISIKFRLHPLNLPLPQQIDADLPTPRNHVASNLNQKNAAIRNQKTGGFSAESKINIPICRRPSPPPFTGNGVPLAPCSPIVMVTRSPAGAACPHSARRGVRRQRLHGPNRNSVSALLPRCREAPPATAPGLQPLLSSDNFARFARTCSCGSACSS
jgi:hypothetical protein